MYIQTYMKNVMLSFLLLVFVFTKPTSAQQDLITIKGVIIDSVTNLPIPGAVLSVVNTNKGNSDEEGKFTISIPSQADLIISSIGYKKRTIGHLELRAQTLFIKLIPDVTALKTVTISTGYQTLPKERATGSFTLLSSEQLNQQAGSSLLARLEGIANGVAFDRAGGGRPFISIRGLSSINASKDALVVVDDFPYAGNIENINPNDVESITILKDAAAASIWGAKAGNGVIVITTKSGKFNQSAKIQANANLSMRDYPYLFSAQNRMSSSDYIDLEQFLFDKGYYTTALGNTSTFPVVSPVVDILDRRKRGLLSSIEADNQLALLKQNDVRDDVLNHLYTKGINQQYGISINGGSAKNSYTFFTGYDRNENHLAAVNDRLSIRLQNTFKLNEKFALSVGILFTQNNSYSGKDDLSSIRSSNSQSLYPYAKLIDQNGNPLPIVKNYRQSFKDTIGGGKLLDWNYYPLIDDSYINRTNKTQDILGNLNLSYKVLPWLNSSIKYQYEKQQLHTRNLSHEGSFSVNNTINQFTQIDKVTGAVKYIVPRGSILGQGVGTLLAHNLRAQIDADKAWSNFQLNALVGGEVSDHNYNGYNTSVYGYNNELGTINGIIDPVNRYPLIYGGTGTVSNPPTFSGTLNRNLSFYTNAGITYKERYIFSASARKDMANLFGVNTNDKGRPFWSTGFGWLISEEAFYKFDPVPYLKLRLTYGYSGNVDNSLSAVTTISYSSNVNALTGYPFALVTKFADPDLRWEKTGTTNFALDFRLKNDRLVGSLEYYKKNASDLLGDALFDVTAGLKVNTLRKNVASMSATGIDFNLTSRQLVGKFKWNTDVIFNWNRNRLDEYYIRSYQGSTYINAQGTIITPIIGKPVFSVLSYKWAGLNPLNGNPRGYINGTVSEVYSSLTGTATTLNDLVYHGSATPIYAGAVNNLLQFKNVSLSFNIAYKLGHYFRKSSINYNSLFSGWLQHVDYAKRWQKAGDERVTEVPSLVYPANATRDAFYNNSEVLVRKADHVRLQFINLSYSLTREQLRRLPVKNMRLNLNMSNVGVLWTANDEKIDPDNAYGLTTPRSFACGLQVNF